MVGFTGKLKQIQRNGNTVSNGIATFPDDLTNWLEPGQLWVNTNPIDPAIFTKGIDGSIVRISGKGGGDSYWSLEDGILITNPPVSVSSLTVAGHNVERLLKHISYITDEKGDTQIVLDIGLSSMKNLTARGIGSFTEPTGASNLYELNDVNGNVKNAPIGSALIKGDDGKWTFGNGGGLDVDAMWNVLGTGTGEQINLSHLTGALNSYTSQSLDGRYLLKSGDNSLGNLTIQNNQVWHAGNSNSHGFDWAARVGYLQKIEVTGRSANSDPHISLANSVNGRVWGIKVGYYQNNEDDFTIYDASTTNTPALRLTAGSTNNMIVNGTTTAQGGLSSIAGYLYIDNKLAMGSGHSSPWLYLNTNNEFENGVYTGSTKLRTDGRLEVGPDGNAVYADMSGHVWARSNFYTPGSFILNNGSRQWNTKISGIDYTITDDSATTVPAFKLNATGNINEWPNIASIYGNTIYNTGNLNSGTPLSLASLDLPYSPGTWVSMAVRNEQLKGMRPTSEGSAHSLYMLEASNGARIAFGGLGTRIGFHGFNKDLIDAGTNSYSWRTYWNLGTNDLTHEGNLYVTNNVSVSQAIGWGSGAHGGGQLRTPVGNGYDSCAIMLNGDGNYVFPIIGFHQPGKYAGNIRMMDANTFDFLNETSASRIDICARNVYAQDGWFRAIGNTGLHNESYGGSIWMQDEFHWRLNKNIVLTNGATQIYINTASPYADIYFGNGNIRLYSMDHTFLRLYPGFRLHVEGSEDANVSVTAGSGDATITTMGGIHAYKQIISDSNIIAKNHVRVGNGLLCWDETNKGFYLLQSDGSPAGLYTGSYLTARKSNNTYRTLSLSNFSVNQLIERIESLEKEIEEMKKGGSYAGN